MLNPEPHSLGNHFSKVKSFSASCARSCLKPISEITLRGCPAIRVRSKAFRIWLIDKCSKQNFNFSGLCTKKIHSKLIIIKCKKNRHKQRSRFQNWSSSSEVAGGSFPIGGCEQKLSHHNSDFWRVYCVSIMRWLSVLTLFWCCVEWLFQHNFVLNSLCLK